MSYNTKDDITQVDLSSASLSTEMSLLDELFPSLGNGESSASTFTNQLAFLLNTLGSSDDESSEGTNLLTPLQLSPPKLNEIHALATANLISQTQEAIMQEYNITDLDFDKTIPSDSVENESILSTQTAVQDDRQMCNTYEIPILEHNILESCIPSTSFDQCGIPDRSEPNSNLSTKCSEQGNQIIDSQRALLDSNSTVKDMFVDHSCVTKVKIKSSLEEVSLTKLYKDPSSVLYQQSDGHLEKQIISENLSTPQLTVPKTLGSLSSAEGKREVETLNFNHSFLNNQTGKHLSKDYTNIHSQTYVQKPHPLPLVKLSDNSNINLNSHTDCDTADQDFKNSNEVLNYVLPPKKRHTECNTVAVTCSDIKAQFEHEDRDAVDYNSQNIKTKTFSGCISTPICKSSNDKGKAQTTERNILFVCVICLKQLSCVEDLELHSTNHLQYSCPFPGCVRTFTYRSHLSYHRQTHGGEKNYQCTECGKVFTKAQHLDVHMITHRQSKPFTCSVCGKGFTTVGNLKNHSRTHSGERPYICDVNGCTKSFAELSSLKKHKITHTGEKCYRCDICGKCFTQASSRSYHMKKHKEKH